MDRTTLITIRCVSLGDYGENEVKLEYKNVPIDELTPENLRGLLRWPGVDQVEIVLVGQVGHLPQD